MLTGFQLDGSPLLRSSPLIGDAVGLGIDRNRHVVACINNLKATVGHVGGINAQKNGQVLDIFDMVVGHSIDVRGKATATGELVVDLFLEEAHGLARELLQKTKEFVTTKKVVEAGVAIDKVFGSTENAVAFGIHFLIIY